MHSNVTSSLVHTKYKLHHNENTFALAWKERVKVFYKFHASNHQISTWVSKVLHHTVHKQLITFFNKSDLDHKASSLNAYGLTFWSERLNHTQQNKPLVWYSKHFIKYSSS